MYNGGKVMKESKMYNGGKVMIILLPTYTQHTHTTV